MNENLSTFLNLSRWLAALMVVLSHARHEMLTDLATVHDPALAIKLVYFFTSFGREAVMIFFVVSGFLVGGVTLDRWTRRGVNMMGYAIARFSRIYTVLIPALIVGALLDWASHNFLGSAIPPGSLSPRVFLSNVFMLGGITNPVLGNNAPLWSLAWEWWYYVAFAVIGWSIATRRTVVAIAAASAFALIAPQRIALWGSIWALGVVAYYWVKSTTWRPHPVLGLGVLLACLVISRCTHSVGMLVEQEPTHIAFAREFMVGAGFMLALVSMSRSRLEIPAPMLHHTLADFSYTTYLVHMPAVIFIASAAGAMHMQPNAISIAALVALVAFVYAYAYAFSRLTERHTPVVRKWLSDEAASNHDGLAKISAG